MKVKAIAWPLLTHSRCCCCCCCCHGDDDDACLSVSAPSGPRYLFPRSLQRMLHTATQTPTHARLWLMIKISVRNMHYMYRLAL